MTSWAAARPAGAPYAAHPGQAGLGTYEQEASAALTFLAGQQQVNQTQLAVFGHSEGGIYALLLASGLAGPAPAVHAVVLLEPVPIRFLGLVEQSTIASDTVADYNESLPFSAQLRAALKTFLASNL